MVIQYNFLRLLHCVVWYTCTDFFNGTHEKTTVFYTLHVKPAKYTKYQILNSLCHSSDGSLCLRSAVAWIQDQVKSCVGSVVARAALGRVFSEYFSFLAYHSVYHLLHNHLSSRDGTMASVLVERLETFCSHSHNRNDAR
jgi:hypothetical protein